MKLFSERYGYTKPADCFIREQITDEIQNVICTNLDILNNDLNSLRLNYKRDTFYYENIERDIWCNFLNQRIKDFYHHGNTRAVCTTYIESTEPKWYEKLDLVEMILQILYSSNYTDSMYYLQVVNQFVNGINRDFKRLHYAYRIVDKKIVEITREEEIKSIEETLSESSDAVKNHLNEALKLYSKRPEPDCRNSIKESISAVEALCRDFTGEKTLGEALKKLESKGLVLHPQLRTAINQLYTYTNQPDTGIRHALMDETGTYKPTSDEAYFMLVSCSAFINYLRRKMITQ